MFSFIFSSNYTKPNTLLIPYVRGNFTGNHFHYGSSAPHSIPSAENGLRTMMGGQFPAAASMITENDIELQKSFAMENVNDTTNESTFGANNLSENGIATADEFFIDPNSIVSLIYLSYMPICCLIGLTGNAMSITLIR